MKYLYHGHAYDFHAPAPSWWEDSAGVTVETDDLANESNVCCDVAVIGGGYTGLSAAYHLACDYGTDVRVLDAGRPGWGASGRNGGFCGPGALKRSRSSLLRDFGSDAVKAFGRMQRDAVDLVAELLEKEQIDADKTGHRGEICFAHRPNRIPGLIEEAKTPDDIFPFRTNYLDRDDCRAFGIAGPEVWGGLLMNGPFGLHPLKYCQGLARAAQRRGAVLHHDAQVTGWRREGRDHLLSTPGGVVRARKVIIGTNGYTPEDLHAGLADRLLPTLTNILVTRPLSREEKEAQGWTATDVAFDTRKLLHYVRLLPDGRFLFGGRGGWDASPQGVETRRRVMVRHFRKMFPAWRDVGFTHFWNGFVCLTFDRVVHIGFVDDDPTIVAALAYHGSGVATATWNGRMAARLVAGAADINESVPAMMRDMPPRFPMPWLRKATLKVAGIGYGIRDEWL